MIETILKYYKARKEYFIFLFIVLLYVCTRFTVLPSGDSVVNITQIENYDIYSRSTHFTFHLLGVGFYSVLHFFFGFSGVICTEIMLITVSVIGALLFYNVLKEIFPDRNIPVITVLVYSFSSGIWRFSVQSEYVVIVPSVALISFYFFQKNKYLISGLFLGFGFLASPFVLLMSPFYLYFLKKDDKNVRKIVGLIAGFMIVSLLVNIFTYEETVKGNWSYNMIIPYYFKFLRPARMIMMLLYGYIRSFHIIIPFILLGLFLLFKINRKLFWITIIIFIFHLPVTANEARQGAYQFGVYPFFAIAAGIGIFKLFEKRKYVIQILLVIFVILNFLIVNSEKTYSNNLVESYIKLNFNKNIADSSIVFTYHHTKLLKHYAPKFYVAGLTDEFNEYKLRSLFSEWEGSRIDTLMESKRDKYLLETGIRMPDDALKVKFPSIFSKQGALVKGYGKIVLEKYMKGKTFILLPEYNIDVYKIIDN